MGTKKAKIGENGYRLIEENFAGVKCVTLMYKDWYVLRFNQGMIELATSIEREREFEVDEKGRVQISKNTF